MRTASFTRFHLAAAALAVVALTGAAWLHAAPTVAPGSYAYVSNSGDDTVSVVDLETMTTVGSPIPVGGHPRGSTTSRSGEFVYVANRSSDTVSVIATATNTVVATVPLTGSNPNDVAITPDGETLYVACRSSHTVSVVSTATNTETTTIDLAVALSPGPKGIAITPDGAKVYTANTHTGTVDVISTATNTVVASPISVSGGARDIMVSSDGSRVVVVYGGMASIIDTATDTVVAADITGTGNYRHVDVAGDMAYASRSFHPGLGGPSLDVIDLATGTLVSSIPLTVTSPEGVLVSPDGTIAWVSGNGTVQAVDLVAEAEFGNPVAVGSVPRSLTGLFPKSGNVPPPNTIRSFFLPKRIVYRVRKQGARTTAAGFLDTGPDPVDLTMAGQLVVGPRVVDHPGLTPSKNGRRFTYQDDGVKLKVIPTRTGSSRAKFVLRIDGDLGGPVDVNGEITLRYTGGGVDAESTVVLENGVYKFGKLAGTLVAPDIHIRKAKARILGGGRDGFKFLAGLSGDGTTPDQAPELFVGFGDVYNSVIPPDALKLRGRNYVLGTPIATGVKALLLNYAKERVALTGAQMDLGDVPEGPAPLLLIFEHAGEVRAVYVRAVRKGKQLRY